MLNPDLKLNSHILDADESAIDMQPIRKGFGLGLVAGGEKDERVVALCADLTESTQMNLFKEKFPKRFVEVGVAEQNLASVASGMAAVGKVPVISSYAMFSPGRNWEQIRTTICYNNQKVVIAGNHAGVSVGPDGGSHQAVEDVAIVRVIPNITVFTPCDVIEAEKATRLSLTDQIKTPVYIRLAREKTPVITTAETPFDPLRAEYYFIPSSEILEKNDGHLSVGIIAMGSLVFNALKAAAQLEKEGYAVKVLNIHTVKPIDTERICELAQDAGCLVTVEEHQIIGGLGGAVAETITAKLNRPVPIEYIGMHDQFGQSGKPAELIKHYGMSIDHIVAAAKKAIERKG